MTHNQLVDKIAKTVEVLGLIFMMVAMIGGIALVVYLTKYFVKAVF